MPKIKKQIIGDDDSVLSVEYSSGFLNHPVRVIQQFSDCLPLSYPTITRTGFEGLTGNEDVIPFDDSKTIVFDSAYATAWIYFFTRPKDGSTIKLFDPAGSISLGDIIASPDIRQDDLGVVADNPLVEQAVYEVEIVSVGSPELISEDDPSGPGDQAAIDAGFEKEDYPVIQGSWTGIKNLASPQVDPASQYRLDIGNISFPPPSAGPPSLDPENFDPGDFTVKIDGPGIDPVLTEITFVMPDNGEERAIVDCIALSAPDESTLSYYEGLTITWPNPRNIVTVAEEGTADSETVFDVRWDGAGSPGWEFYLPFPDVFRWRKSSKTRLSWDEWQPSAEGQHIGSGNITQELTIKNLRYSNVDDEGYIYSDSIDVSEKYAFLTNYPTTLSAKMYARGDLSPGNDNEYYEVEYTTDGSTWVTFPGTDGKISELKSSQTGDYWAGLTAYAPFADGGYFTEKDIQYVIKDDAGNPLYLNMPDDPSVTLPAISTPAPGQPLQFRVKVGSEVSWGRCELKIVITYAGDFIGVDGIDNTDASGNNLVLTWGNFANHGVGDKWTINVEDSTNEVFEFNRGVITNPSHTEVKVDKKSVKSRDKLNSILAKAINESGLQIEARHTKDRVLLTQTMPSAVGNISIFADARAKCFVSNSKNFSVGADGAITGSFSGGFDHLVSYPTTLPAPVQKSSEGSLYWANRPASEYPFGADEPLGTQPFQIISSNDINLSFDVDGNKIYVNDAEDIIVASPTFPDTWADLDATQSAAGYDPAVLKAGFIWNEEKWRTQFGFVYRAFIESPWLTNQVVTPNSLSYDSMRGISNAGLIATGSTKKGVSDYGITYSEKNDAIKSGPFYDTSLTPEDEEFYQAGIPSEKYEGFSSPLHSKTKISIDLPIDSVTKFGFDDVASYVDTGAGTTVVNTFHAMVYYNFATRSWEKIGAGFQTIPREKEEIQEFFENACIGFSRGAELIQSAAQVASLPISDFGFPMHPKFDASEDQTLDMSKYINKPFALEKFVIEFDAAWDEGSDYAKRTVMYDVGLDGKITRSDEAGAHNNKAVINNFFILNQRDWVGDYEYSSDGHPTKFWYAPNYKRNIEQGDPTKIQKNRYMWNGSNYQYRVGSSLVSLFRFIQAEGVSDEDQVIINEITKDAAPASQRNFDIGPVYGSSEASYPTINADSAPWSFPVGAPTEGFRSSAHFSAADKTVLQIELEDALGLDTPDLLATDTVWGISSRDEYNPSPSSGPDEDGVTNDFSSGYNHASSSSTVDGGTIRVVSIGPDFSGDGESDIDNEYPGNWSDVFLFSNLKPGLTYDPSSSVKSFDIRLVNATPMATAGQTHTFRYIYAQARGEIFSELFTIDTTGDGNLDSPAAGTGANEPPDPGMESRAGYKSEALRFQVAKYPHEAALNTSNLAILNDSAGLDSSNQSEFDARMDVIDSLEWIDVAVHEPDYQKQGLWQEGAVSVNQSALFGDDHTGGYFIRFIQEGNSGWPDSWLLGDISVDIDPSFSHSLWFKPAAASTSMNLISVVDPDAVPNKYWLMIAKDGTLRLLVDSGRNRVYTRIISQQVVTDGLWHNAVLSYNGSTSEFNLWLDGSFIGAYTIPQGEDEEGDLLWVSSPLIDPDPVTELEANITVQNLVDAEISPPANSIYHDPDNEAGHNWYSDTDLEGPAGGANYYDTVYNYTGEEYITVEGIKIFLSLEEYMERLGYRPHRPWYFNSTDYVIVGADADKGAGIYPFKYDNHFTGEIADIAVWDSAIDGISAKAIYNLRSGYYKIGGGASINLQGHVPHRFAAPVGSTYELRDQGSLAQSTGTISNELISRYLINVPKLKIDVEGTNKYEPAVIGSPSYHEDSPYIPGPNASLFGNKKYCIDLQAKSYLKLGRLGEYLTDVNYAGDVAESDFSFFTWIKIPDVKESNPVIFSINTSSGKNRLIFYIDTADRLYVKTGANAEKPVGNRLALYVSGDRDDDVRDAYDGNDTEQGNLFDGEFDLSVSKNYRIFTNLVRDIKKHEVVAPIDAQQIDTGEWVHVGFTHEANSNGSTFEIYVNGEVQNTHIETVWKKPGPANDKYLLTFSTDGDLDDAADEAGYHEDIFTVDGGWVEEETPTILRAHYEAELSSSRGKSPYHGSWTLKGTDRVSVGQEYDVKYRKFFTTTKDGQRTYKSKRYRKASQRINARLTDITIWKGALDDQNVKRLNQSRYGTAKASLPHASKAALARDLVTFGQWCIYASTNESSTNVSDILEAGLSRELNTPATFKSEIIDDAGIATGRYEVIDHDGEPSTPISNIGNYKMEGVVKRPIKHSSGLSYRVGTGRNQLSSRTVFKTSHNGTRTGQDNDIFSPRGIFNTVPGSRVSKEYYDFGLERRGYDRSTVKVYENYEQVSPYILMPSDKLVFGWQCAMPYDFGRVNDTAPGMQMTLGSSLTIDKFGGEIELVDTATAATMPIGDLHYTGYYIDATAKKSDPTTHYVSALSNSTFLRRFNCQPATTYSYDLIVGSTTENVTSSAIEWTIDEYKEYFGLAAKHVKISLYGSYISDNKEAHDPSNQNLTSDAAHEALQFETPVFDRFHLEDIGYTAGSYIDDVVLGKMMKSDTLAQTAGSDRFGSFYERLNRQRAGSVAEHTQGPDGSCLKGVRLIDERERYFDTVVASPADYHQLNGNGILEWSSPVFANGRKIRSICIGEPNPSDEKVVQAEITNIACQDEGWYEPLPQGVVRLTFNRLWTADDRSGTSSIGYYSQYLVEPVDAPSPPGDDAVDSDEGDIKIELPTSAYDTGATYQYFEAVGWDIKQTRQKGVVSINRKGTAKLDDDEFVGIAADEDPGTDNEGYFNIVKGSAAGQNYMFTSTYETLEDAEAAGTGVLRDSYITIHDANGDAYYLWLQWSADQSTPSAISAEANVYAVDMTGWNDGSNHWNLLTLTNESHSDLWDNDIHEEIENSSDGDGTLRYHVNNSNGTFRSIQQNISVFTNAGADDTDWAAVFSPFPHESRYMTANNFAIKVKDTIDDNLSEIFEVLTQSSVNAFLEDSGQCHIYIRTISGGLTAVNVSDSSDTTTRGGGIPGVHYDVPDLTTYLDSNSYVYNAKMASGGGKQIIKAAYLSRDLDNDGVLLYNGWGTVIQLPQDAVTFSGNPGTEFATVTAINNESVAASLGLSIDTPGVNEFVQNLEPNNTQQYRHQYPVIEEKNGFDRVVGYTLDGCFFQIHDANDNAYNIWYKLDDGLSEVPAAPTSPGALITVSSVTPGSPSSDVAAATAAAIAEQYPQSFITTYEQGRSFFKIENTSTGETKDADSTIMGLPLTTGFFLVDDLGFEYDNETYRWVFNWAGPGFFSFSKIFSSSETYAAGRTPESEEVYWQGDPIQEGTNAYHDNTNNTIDSYWLGSYPFEPRYSSLFRGKFFKTDRDWLVTNWDDETGEFTETNDTSNSFYTVILTGSNIENKIIDPTLDSEEGYNVLPLLGTGDADLLSSFMLKTTRAINTEFLKFYFGSGDTWQKNPNLQRVNLYSDGYDWPAYVPKIRGWKYGLLSALPSNATAVYRHDSFGQFRDMLEQRSDARFYKTLTRGRFKGRGYPAAAPVRVRFVDVDGRLTAPEKTWSQNLSRFCTSSLPFFDDGVPRNREIDTSQLNTSLGIIED